jgi:hypothetical protein
MARARFSIGIDLGTTNSALAFVPLVGETTPEILQVSQWESLGHLSESPTLPSFLYLPEDAVAVQLRGRTAGAGAWIAGRFARTKAGETPGRIVHSAKSWLCHHAADRLEPFLPWGSTDLPREQKISPVHASALILSYLRGAWNDRFAATGFPFDEQEITVTVPASFDAAAQRLTIAAAEDAGFPARVRLLEEPQAAFYCWLERHPPGDEVWQHLDGPRHVLVVDIGGGTSDFSLFELRPGGSGPIPDIRRVAVSEHILLGGDNIDLALAHLVERQLTGGGHGHFSGAQWDQLVAASRNLKEQALSGTGPENEHFTVAVAGRGSGLFAAAQTASVTRADIEGVLLNGFFPDCDASARPYQTQGGLREWGLPYATDSAITRHLADFLRDRPRVDAVLFNGGSVTPAVLRDRIAHQIGRWQDGAVLLELENSEPALAVARGAARYGALLHRQAGQIAAGAARAVFLEIQGVAAEPSVVCVLPRGAAPEQPFEITIPALEVRTDQPVRFQAFSSTRHGRSKAGEIMPWRENEFHALPPLQTIVRTGDASEAGTVPVRLLAKMNALGLLQVSCVSADPERPQSWPLEFNLRPQEHGGGLPSAARDAGTIEPNATAEQLEAAQKRIGSMLSRPSSPALKIGSGPVFKSLEGVLGQPRGAWNAPLLRALWRPLSERFADRRLSVEHEEAWVVLAGYLLRPGFGVAGDDLRVDSLWRVHESGPCFPGRRIANQEYLLWRRVAAGLSRERQTALVAGDLDRLLGGKAPDEFVRLAGSLELIPGETKIALINRFIEIAVEAVYEKKPCAPYLNALGHLLNRTPLRAGPETVVSPDLVEHAFDALRKFDWAEEALAETQTLFLRATRVVDDRSIDVPAPVRTQIAAKLEKAGVSARRTAKIRGFVPIGRSDRASLYDESLPPGLILGGGADSPL